MTVGWIALDYLVGVFYRGFFNWGGAGVYRVYLGT